MSEPIDLKRLHMRRGYLKGQLTRFINFLNTCDEKSSEKNTQLQARLDTLKDTFIDFNNIQSEIEYSDETSELATHASEREEFEAKYFEAVGRARKCLQSQVSAPLSDTPPRGNRSSDINTFNIKLPQINLPEFSGSYEKWTEFHDTFKALINDNPILTKIQKYYYLQACLKNEAAQVITSLSVSEENYEIAWQLLTERFQNKRAIVSAHIKGIVELPNINKESHNLVRSFLDAFLKHYRALERLDESVKHWDTILIYLLASKLDIISRKEWESYIKNNQLPKICDFTTFLTERCHLLEALPTKPDTKPYTNAFIKKHTDFKSQAHIATNKISCVVCQGTHYIYSCKKFLDMPINTRFAEAKRLRLCTNCLRLGHSNSECMGGSCRTCHKKHNSLLHNVESQSPACQETVNTNANQFNSRNKQSNSNESNNITQSPQVDTPQLPDVQINHCSINNINSHCSQQQRESFVLLSTAQVYIYGSNDQPVQCRALLDNGSQSNFATSDLIQRLGISTSKIDLPVSGIGQTVSIIKKQANIKIKSMHNEYKTKLPCLVVDKITDIMPQRKFSTERFEIPEAIKLADPNFNHPSQVDLLIGAGVFFDLLCVGQIKLGRGQPTLHKTKLGWVVSGHIFNPLPQVSQSCFITTNLDLHNQLERFWQLEESHNIKTYSKEEMECENHFVQNFQRDNTGRFTVKLPLRDNYTDLGNSQENAIRRFYAIERKFTKNPKLKEEYCKFMAEYESLGHMSRINPSENTDNLTYYIPHHCVEKQSSLTTKLRVVFDASAKTTTGLSLNDTLKIGPTIQSDLFTIIIRFRQHNIVLTGDITKMYRQINIDPAQRDLQRIVWRDSPEAQLGHFRLNTVSYGTASASFLSTRCINQLAIEQLDSFPHEAKTIMTDFYVDDLLTGSHDIDSMITIRKNITDILNSAGFELRKFASNDPRVLEDLSNKHENISQYIITDNEHIKTLGVTWNPSSDNFEYDSKPFTHSLAKVSKRTILSYVSQIFDPLGLLGPIIIQAKIILQELWQLHIDWDESVPSNLHTAWFNFYSQLDQIHSIRIPRHVILPDALTIQLHGFCDSSERAYGAALYIRSQSSIGTTQVSLLCAKSRVAPLKAISLPRLELCGALLLAQLIHKIKTVLSIQIDDTYLWTDSTIVLAWLSREPNTWHTFVCNRVSEIQQLTRVNEWHHIASPNNPADIISRGIKPRDLIDSILWWNGPSFLKLGPHHWPAGSHISNFTRTNSDTLEIKRQVTMLSYNTNLDIFERYSNLTKLQRIVAYCLRFRNNARLPMEARQGNSLTIQELADSTKILIKITQAQSFADDLYSLQQSRKLKSGSKLASLDPFLDNDGIIRVGGRLKYAKLAFNHKHPILLPQRHPLTILIITFEHLRNLHAGPQATLSFIRQNYWPLNGKQAVKAVLRKCVICFKAKPTSIFQKMGDLPYPRVNPSRIFSTCGVDYAGPFQIKDGKTRNRKIVKGYICIFVCLASKAVHLELASELTTDAFMNSLKRFVSRRGLCRKIYSDNATNFVGSNKELTEINNVLKNDKFNNYLSQCNIEWHFIPARSPHMGGLWEAAVKSVKHHLYRVTTNFSFTYEEFYTLLAQVEAVLNSRPLVPISDNPTDLEAITPGHFLIGEPLNAVPEVNLKEIPIKHLSRYQHICKMTQDIWGRWSAEYLHQLQQRTKWRFQKEAPLLIGALVLLKEDNTPTLHWPMGRILETHPGEDGVVRVISVKTRNSVLKRALNKVCLLPIE